MASMAARVCCPSPTGGAAGWRGTAASRGSKGRAEDTRPAGAQRPAVIGPFPELSRQNCHPSRTHRCLQDEVVGLEGVGALLPQEALGVVGDGGDVAAHAVARLGDQHPPGHAAVLRGQRLRGVGWGGGLWAGPLTGAIHVAGRQGGFATLVACACVCPALRGRRLLGRGGEGLMLTRV